MRNLSSKIEEVKARYIARAERVEKVVNSTSDEWVEPGYYNVVESDHGGMYDYTVFKIHVKEGINLKELALKLIEERDYMSSWNYLKIEPTSAPEIYSV